MARPWAPILPASFLSPLCALSASAPLVALLFGVLAAVVEAASVEAASVERALVGDVVVEEGGWTVVEAGAVVEEAALEVVLEADDEDDDWEGEEGCSLPLVSHVPSRSWREEVDVMVLTLVPQLT